jgi:hypothetical protein
MKTVTLKTNINKIQGGEYDMTIKPIMLEIPTPSIVTVVMISGEKITGVLLQETPNYIYVETVMDYDELAIQIYGREYCEANKTLINKLPKDEIKEIR